MQAAVINKPGNVKLVEREYPKVNKNEVLVRVKSVGLCGSDIGLYQGKYKSPHSYPIIFGHEWSGEVIETGENVFTFHKKDRITGDCSLWCGDCPSCEKNKNLCQNIQKFGITTDGACREYFSIDQKYLYKASSKIPFEMISLTEPLSVSMNALSKVNGKNMRKALVIGAGAIGLSAIFFLKNYYGYEIVDVSDFIDLRLEIASELGADSVTQKSSKITNNYDLIVVAAGSNEALDQALRLARPEGTILCIGHLKNEPANLGLIINKALNIVGSIGGTGQFQTILNILEGHYSKLNSLVSHKIDFNSVENAFEIAQMQEKSIKVAINME